MLSMLSALLCYAMWIFVSFLSAVCVQNELETSSEFAHVRAHDACAVATIPASTSQPRSFYNSNQTSPPALSSFALHSFHPPQMTPLAHRILSRVCTTILHSPANFFTIALCLSSCFLWNERQNRWIVIAARGHLEAERRREARKERDA